MPSSSGESDVATRAAKLREAADLVTEFAPEDDDRQRRDKVDILRRLGLLMSNLSGHAEYRTCRRCNAEFTFNPGWFGQRNLSLPTHCDACRAARRVERGRVGVTHNVPEP